ncbi:MAG TPA: hypothetical protein GXX39_01250 [Syntrophothermus lipocalidus]|uniref:Uncharacterized protein n=1 Tax=Syntrophothermus lipocalidus (strain DSM 12680 / TGB-C1) TaxID=643648 RepID=D7CN87_SYNLT|nr:hypothetical protein [Syntrophothermus lipocalidus]ADI02172.1 hypothetical protein Slip_1409 [Syntrophothermus lipocalidus DSM 12680]HHV75985.1 hypothetical protein [Syntrophothermus lipocalidus]
MNRRWDSPYSHDNILPHAYLWNLVAQDIHLKLGLTGLVFVVFMWFQLDFSFIFMTMNLLGMTWLFILYCHVGGDCPRWRGAAFQFGFGACAACTLTVLGFLCFGKPFAIQVGCLAYSFFAAHYLLGCFRTLETRFRL